jgi:FtsH-binding integral membrane protein
MKYKVYQYWAETRRQRTVSVPKIMLKLVLSLVLLMWTVIGWFGWSYPRLSVAIPCIVVVFISFSTVIDNSRFGTVTHLPRRGKAYFNSTG